MMASNFRVILRAFVLLGVFSSLTLTGFSSERWEEAIAEFERSDRENPPPEGAILFVGSSSIRGWTSLAEDFPRYRVINRGFGGSEVADSLHFADRIVLPYKPATIVLYAGENDLSAGLTPERVAEDFRAFVTRVRRDLPETRIAYITMKPSPSRVHLIEAMRTGNQLIRDYAAGLEKVDVIDVFGPMLNADGQPREEIFVEDRLHLNEKGYALWTGIVGAYLKGVEE